MSPSQRHTVRSIACAVTAAALVLAAATPSSGAPGDLDPIFGRGGIRLTRFAGSYGGAEAVAVAPDGRIVIAGQMVRAGTVDSDMAVARYDPDGSLDRTFGNRGRRRIDFAGSYDAAAAVAIRPDGGIVVAGSSSGRLAVAQLHRDGRIDPSFGARGRVTLSPGPGESAAEALALQPDGRVVLAGSEGSDVLTVRLTAAGERDPSFDGDGVAITDFGFGYDHGNAVAIQANGRIVVGGWAAVAATNSVDFGLVRYRRDGSRDPSFGTGGLVTTDFLGFGDEVADLALQPDGRIVAGGSALSDPGSADQSSDFALARYRRDGRLDRSFGDGGRVRTDAGSLWDAVRGIDLEPDGSIVAAGEAYGPLDLDVAIAGYAPSGAPDPSFGEGGLRLTDVAGGTDETGGVAVQADGRILVAGTAFAGLTPDGPTFGMSLLRYQA